MYVQQFFIEGLGCASYLIGCEAQGVAAVVDPDREVNKYLQAAQARGLKITHIIETHLHADHVSGNTDLAARTGAQIFIHEAAKAAYPHTGLNDGDVLELGKVKMAVQHTPGHTPESITLLVSDTTRAEEPWMALTGDLLFVGDAGRPDLVSPEAAQSLAGDLYDSLYGKILPQQDSLLIYPGHGAGSLCGRAIGSVRSTTLGFERQHNPALQVSDRQAFIEFATSNLPEQPGNHRAIKAMNRKGPRPLGDVQPKPLSVQEAIRIFQHSAALLDLRQKADFVQRHVPGSVHIPLGEQLSNRVGFVLPPEIPLVLLLGNENDYAEAVIRLARVGYDQVAGYLKDGIAGWEALGLPVTSGDIQDVSAQELKDLLANSNGSRPALIDVREPWEYAQGHIPSAQLIPLGQLASKIDKIDPSHPVAVVCASGNRSQSAAALLGQKGFAKVYNLTGGMSEWEMAGYQVTLE